ncbi:1,4-dihydroxy-2-naphthoyl-CoA hydrolase, partial [Coleofasciculus sp. LEGE 07081]
VHTSVDFFYPLFCGDRVLILLTPQHLSESKFEIVYKLTAASQSHQQLAKAVTRHVCIEPMTRTKTQLPESVMKWLGCWRGDR